jgi:8-oxo-dGTP pyrophosphatase MutT (NUDIX family)
VEVLGARPPAPFEAVSALAGEDGEVPRLRFADPATDLAPTTDLAVALGHLREASLAHPDSARHRAEVVAFVERHADAAHRSNAVGHLTGSALVVDGAGERTLLLLHRKLGRWFQPGGHADGDANLAGVAHKEATEETGLSGLRVVLPAIDVDVHRVAPPGEVPHLHLDVRFLVVAPPDAVAAHNHESLDQRWVGLADLDGLEPPVDPGTRRLVATGLALASALLADDGPDRR